LAHGKLAINFQKRFLMYLLGRQTRQKEGERATNGLGFRGMSLDRFFCDFEVIKDEKRRE